MGKRTSRVRVTAALAAVLVVAAATPAQATYYDGGMPRLIFTYRAVGMNATWIAHYDTGNIRWNQRVTSQIGRSTSAVSSATAGSYSASWYGLYTPGGVGRNNRTFTIQLNSRTIVAAWNSSSSNLTKYSRIIATHELGHSVSLADNPAVSNSSIMKYTWGNTEVPTSYDISEVARIY